MPTTEPSTLHGRAVLVDFSVCVALLLFVPSFVCDTFYLDSIRAILLSTSTLIHNM